MPDDADDFDVPAMALARRMLARRADNANLRTQARVTLPRVVALPRSERVDYEYPDVERPKTRGDCKDAPRPCPFVSCAHHLFLEVNQAGGLTLRFPDIEVGEMKETCALDVADRGGLTLEEVGEHLGITRERVRQIELGALRKAKEVMPR